MAFSEKGMGLLAAYSLAMDRQLAEMIISWNFLSSNRLPQKDRQASANGFHAEFRTLNKKARVLFSAFIFIAFLAIQPSDKNQQA